MVRQQIIIHLVKAATNHIYYIIELRNHIYYIIELRNTRISPHIKGFNLGETGVFKCNSTIETVWTYNGNVLPNDVSQRQDIIYIDSGNKKNQGLYECRGTYRGPNGDNIKFAARGIFALYSKFTK